MHRIFMTAQSVNTPPWRLPMVDGVGRVTSAWQWWFVQMFDRTGGTTDKVDAAHTAALGAVPQSTEVVAGGGLQIGGALGGNVALALYRAKAVVANLPASGNSEGDWAYALDGRKTGESPGNGSGVPVWWSTPAGVGGWYTDSGSAVAA
jgi:hypothetical protein